MMDIKFYTLVAILSVSAVDGRLIHKNKTKSSEVVPADNPNPAIRLTREIDDEVFSGLDKEDIVNDEFLKSYDRRHRKFTDSNSKFARLIRHLSENIKKKHYNIEPHNSLYPSRLDKPVPRYYETDLQPKHNRAPHYKNYNARTVVLVKKPIPKFIDLDTDEYFQSKMSLARAIINDNGDHEDEDFSVDDYEFDVNHDEFLSGRKPLEPRVNLKDLENVIAGKPAFKVISKIDEPKDNSLIKRQGSGLHFSKASLDYYDDVTTTTEPDRSSQATYDEYGDDVDEGKKQKVRSIRSWDMDTYMKKFGDKTSKLMTKVLSVLPMFPKVPNNRHLYKS